MVVGNRHLVLASWQRVLNTIRIELAGDPAGLADVAQLVGLCESQDRAAFVPVTEAELSSNVYRRVHEFGAIVDEVTAKLVADEILDTKRLRSAAANGWYGRYAWLRGVGVLFHVSTEKWTKFGASPLWLTAFGSNWHQTNAEPVKKALAAHEVANPGSVHLDALGFPTVMIPVPAGAEKHEVVTAASEQIVRVGEVLAPLGTTTTETEPPEIDEEP